MVMVQEMIAMFSFMLASLVHSIIITKFKNVYGSPDYQLGEAVLEWQLCLCASWM